MKLHLYRLPEEEGAARNQDIYLSSKRHSRTQSLKQAVGISVSKRQSRIIPPLETCQRWYKLKTISDGVRCGFRWRNTDSVQVGIRIQKGGQLEGSLRLRNRQLSLRNRHNSWCNYPRVGRPSAADEYSATRRIKKMLRQSILKLASLRTFPTEVPHQLRRNVSPTSL